MSGRVFHAGYNFAGERARKAEDGLARLAAANAKRQPCPHCGLAISPEGFARHVELCGEPE